MRKTGVCGSEVFGGYRNTEMRLIKKKIPLNEQDTLCGRRIRTAKGIIVVRFIHIFPSTEFQNNKLAPHRQPRFLSNIN